MVGVTYMCHSQLLLEETVNMENTNLFLSSGFFNSSCLIFEEGASDALNYKSQQQPSSFILDLVVQLLIFCGSGQSCFSGAIIAFNQTRDEPDVCLVPPRLLPHPPQVSASFTHQQLHTTSKGKNWLLSGIRRHKHGPQHCHLLS